MEGKGAWEMFHSLSAWKSSGQGDEEHWSSRDWLQVWFGCLQQNCAFCRAWSREQLSALSSSMSQARRNLSHLPPAALCSWSQAPEMEQHLVEERGAEPPFLAVLSY